MTLPRRTFLKAALTLIAAPAIVRVASIMPVKALVLPEEPLTIYTTQALYAQLCDVTRQAFVPRLFVQLYATNPMLDMLQEPE